MHLSLKLSKVYNIIKSQGSNECAYGNKYFLCKFSVTTEIWYNFLGWDNGSIKIFKLQKKDSAINE
jgi:hypothetical protein